jgi:thiol-disulfide isomerase/thioredoxin
MIIGLLLLFAIVPDVRQAAMQGDLAKAERIAAEFRKTNGVTPEWLNAYSWLGRGALAAKKYDEAERYAAETKKLALAELKKRSLDEEPRLPIALGAAIEVHGQVLAARGQRSEAIAYLTDELETYKKTSIRARIQKNINLLSLEGKPAPKLEGYGEAPKSAVMFFWAHWCGDCKTMAPVLERIQRDFPSVKVIAPTQLYGYASRGEDATPAAETKYIAEVKAQFYPMIKDKAAISKENFDIYGVSTTPTVVYVDSKGIVRLYHPGKMTYDALSERLKGAGALTSTAAR